MYDFIKGLTARKSIWIQFEGFSQLLLQIPTFYDAFL